MPLLALSGGLTRAARVPHGQSFNCPADILPHPRPTRYIGCGSPLAGNTTANIPNAIGGLSAHRNPRLRSPVMFRCSKASAWPKVLHNVAPLSAGLLVIYALTVVPSQRRAITAKQYEEFGRQFKGAMRAAIGTGILIPSQTQSVPKFARVRLLAASLASRSIPEKLSAIWSGVCQSHSALWHSVLSLATIGSELVVKACSMFGGITHRM